MILRRKLRAQNLIKKMLQINDVIDYPALNCNAYEETGFINEDAEPFKEPLSQYSLRIQTPTPTKKLVLDA